MGQSRVLGQDALRALNGHGEGLFLESSSNIRWTVVHWLSSWQSLHESRVLKHARTATDGISEKNVATWTSMTAGLAQQQCTGKVPSACTVAGESVSFNLIWLYVVAREYVSKVSKAQVSHGCLNCT